VKTLGKRPLTSRKKKAINFSDSTSSKRSGPKMKYVDPEKLDAIQEEVDEEEIKQSEMIN
jgi:hypothetical protein